MEHPRLIFDHGQGAAQPGVNFINVLRKLLFPKIPNVQKKTVKSAVSFGAFGTYERKSCTYNVGEIDRPHVSLQMFTLSKHAKSRYAKAGDKRRG